jgi:hypothetical protein
MEAKTMATGEEQKVGSEERSPAYEAPRLVAIGNLRDLLAGGGTQNCDADTPAPSDGDNSTMC